MKKKEQNIKPRGPIAEVWHYFIRNKGAIVGLVILGLIVVAAIAAVIVSLIRKANKGLAQLSTTATTFFISVVRIFILLHTSVSGLESFPSRYLLCRGIWRC